jgi:hypothetical protein
VNHSSWAWILDNISTDVFLEEIYNLHMWSVLEKIRVWQIVHCEAAHKQGVELCCATIVVILFICKFEIVSL